MAQLQIRKGQNQRNHRVDEDPRIHVIRRPPQPNKGSLRHHSQLVRERGRESRRGPALVVLPFDGLGLDSFDLIEGLLEFRRFAP